MCTSGLSEIRPEHAARSGRQAGRRSTRAPPREPSARASRIAVTMTTMDESIGQAVETVRRVKADLSTLAQPQAPPRAVTYGGEMREHRVGARADRRPLTSSSGWRGGHRPGCRTRSAGPRRRGPMPATSSSSDRRSRAACATAGGTSRRSDAPRRECAACSSSAGTLVRQRDAPPSRSRVNSSSSCLAIPTATRLRQPEFSSAA